MKLLKKETKVKKVKLKLKNKIKKIKIKESNLVNNLNNCKENPKK